MKIEQRINNKVNIVRMNKKKKMNTNTVLNKVRELLGMEIKLEERKLDDGVTRIEADAFEPEAEVFIITEDDQRIALPIGEYKLDDGMILIVAVEGIIAEIKEEEAVEEVVIAKPKKIQCNTHSRFKKSCPICVEVAK